LSSAIEQPYVLSGIRTDPVTATSLGLLYQAMTTYRKHHPGALIASVDDADGFSGRVSESLPLLSFFPDNPHPFPVYWNLPVLSSAVYPEYRARFDRFVAAERPLIVDSRRTGFGPRPIPAYYLLAAAPSPAGNWFVYAPEHADSAAHGELAATFDLPPPIVEYFTVPSMGGGRPVPARVAVWPALASRWLAAVPWTQTGIIGEPLYRNPVLKWSADQLAVDGPVDAPYSYLLRTRERPLRTGQYFYATGVLKTGGITVGLLADDRWVGSVNVQQPGAFAIVVAAPRDGTYSLVLANCVSPTWRQRFERERALPAFTGWLRGTLTNAFRIETAGWATAGSDQ
jgi:hypothetical protein